MFESWEFHNLRINYLEKYPRLLGYQYVCLLSGLPGDARGDCLHVQRRNGGEGVAGLGAGGGHGSTDHSRGHCCNDGMLFILTSSAGAAIIVEVALSLFWPCKEREINWFWLLSSIGRASLVFYYRQVCLLIS